MAGCPWYHIADSQHGHTLGRGRLEQYTRTIHWSKTLERYIGDQRLVVLFGDSLLMDGVEASLSAMPELGVMRIHTTVQDVRECLMSLRPDLVIFDWETSQAQLIVSILRDQPGVTLLGLDVSSRKVIAVSSHQFTPLTANDLAQVIQMQTSHRVGQIDLDGVVPDEWRTEILH